MNRKKKYHHGHQHVSDGKGLHWNPFHQDLIDAEKYPTTGVVSDASCIPSPHSKAYGEVEWRVVDLTTGKLVMASRVYEEGTTNLAEFMGLVDALSYLRSNGRGDEPVYCDSIIALNWARRGGHRSRHPRREASEPLFTVVDAAGRWLMKVNPKNRLMHWKKHLWGEPPADYGRKGGFVPSVKAVEVVDKANSAMTCTATSCSYPDCRC